jgi:hypothetical protein
MIIIYFVFILLFVNLLILNKEPFQCKFIPIGDSEDNCISRCNFVKNYDKNCDLQKCEEKCRTCDTPNRCTWFKDLCSTLTKEGEDRCNEMNFACFWDSNKDTCIKRGVNNYNALMNTCVLKNILDISDTIDINTNNNYLIVKDVALETISKFMVLYYNTKNSNGINISLIDNKYKKTTHHIYLNSNELFDSKNNYKDNDKNIINLKKGIYIFYIYYNDTNNQCIESKSLEFKVN